MNRQQRRAADKRKFGAGTVIKTQTITSVATGEHYWFEIPRGYDFVDGGALPPGVALHGPFRTHAEVQEDQRLTLLGPQCEVVEGGVWDPAWDRPQ